MDEARTLAIGKEELMAMIEQAAADKKRNGGTGT